MEPQCSWRRKQERGSRELGEWLGEQGERRDTCCNESKHGHPIESPAPCPCLHFISIKFMKNFLWAGKSLLPELQMQRTDWWLPEVGSGWLVKQMKTKYKLTVVR